MKAKLVTFECGGMGGASYESVEGSCLGATISQGIMTISKVSTTLASTGDIK